MNRAEYSCALWFWRYHSPHYDLYASEEEAARAGAWMEEDGNAAVEGVQFRDGRTLRRKEWPAYAEAERELWEDSSWLEESRNRPPIPKRKIRHPFETDQIIQIEASEPDWIGVPVDDVG